MIGVVIQGVSDNLPSAGNWSVHNIGLRAVFTAGFIAAQIGIVCFAHHAPDVKIMRALMAAAAWFAALLVLFGRKHTMFSDGGIGVNATWRWVCIILGLAAEAYGFWAAEAAYKKTSGGDGGNESLVAMIAVLVAFLGFMGGAYPERPEKPVKPAVARYDSRGPQLPWPWAENWPKSTPAVSGSARVRLTPHTGRRRLTDREIASAAYRAGFRGRALVTAVAIAKAESGGDAKARHRNRGGSVDRGLWQINSVHKWVTPAMANDPGRAAKCAYRISRRGRDFRPWSVYRGAYRKHMRAAERAARQIGA